MEAKNSIYSFTVEYTRNRDEMYRGASKLSEVKAAGCPSHAPTIYLVIFISS